MQENFDFIAYGIITVSFICVGCVLVAMFFIANYGTATQKTLLKFIADQRIAQATPARLKTLTSWQVVRLQQGISETIGQQISQAANALAELSAPETIQSVEQIEPKSAVFKYVIQIQQSEHLRSKLNLMVQGLMTEFEKQGQTTEIPEDVIAETLEAMQQQEF